MLNKLVILLVSFINGCYCAEKVGIIDEDFFKEVGTIVSIRNVVPHDNHFMAIVDATTSYDSRTTSLIPFYIKTWEHDDVKKVSKCKILATVICGTKTLEFTLPLKEEVPYHYLRDVEDKTSELTLGSTVTFYCIKEFERADKTIFREKGLSLYMLTLKEERAASHDVSVCFKEWTITSQWQRKTRHSRRIYSAIDIYHTTLKRMCNVTGSDDEIINKELVRKELTFKNVDAESPECGTCGGNLPNKAIIIT